MDLIGAEFISLRTDKTNIKFRINRSGDEVNPMNKLSYVYCLCIEDGSRVVVIDGQKARRSNRSK